MRSIEVLEFYSKCKAPTKEEREMKSLGMNKTEYEAYKNLRRGIPDSWLWFIISKRNVVTRF